MARVPPGSTPFPRLAERQRQHEDLGDALDRKRRERIAGRIGGSIDGGDGNAELVGIDLGKFGNVIRNLPSPSLGAMLS